MYFVVEKIVDNSAVNYLVADVNDNFTGDINIITISENVLKKYLGGNYLAIENYELKDGKIHYSQGSEKSITINGNKPVEPFIHYFLLLKYNNRDNRRGNYRVLVFDGNQVITGTINLTELESIYNQHLLMNAHIVYNNGAKPFVKLNAGNLKEIDDVPGNPVEKVEVSEKLIKDTDIPVSSESNNLKKKAINTFNDYKNKPSSELVDIIGDKGYTEKQQEFLKNHKPKKFGSFIKRAFLLGAVCVTLGTSLTGCGFNKDSALANAPYSVEQQSSVKDCINTLNSASKIHLDVKNFTLNTRVDVYVDDEKIGECSGKFLKFYDTLKIKDINDNIISYGDQNIKILKDSWGVYNSQGDLQYQLKENFTLVRNSYDIYDSEGNFVAKIQQHIFHNIAKTGKSATVEDKDGNVIAEITQNAFRKDFDIVINDDCTIDGSSMTTLGINYMVSCMQKEAEQNSHHNSEASKSN